MKIISKFKDYYDHVANRYGGGDPRLIYNRNQITGQRISGFEDIILGNTRVFRSVNDVRNKTNLHTYSFNILFFCGRQFLLVKNGTEVFPLSETKHADLWKELMNPRKNMYGLFVNTDDYIAKFIGAESDKALQTCLQYNQPVLQITNSPSVKVDDKIPVLQNIGFGSVMSAEQCYQEISHFIGNVLRQSPDTRPPVQTEDKYKIIAAGFDTKKSFRHRT